MFFNYKMRMITIFTVAMVAFMPWPNARAAESDFDVGAIGSPSVSAKDIQWHGYYEFHYFDQEGSKASYDAHKIVIWMGVPINDKVFLSSELEYEHFPRLGEAKFDAGANDIDKKTGGSGEIKVDSAQLSITPFEGLRGYVGIWYVPFGIEYLSYPGYKNKLVSRPKVMKSNSIIPGTWADVGIGFSNTFEGIGHLDVYSINGDANNGGISRDSSTGGNRSKSLGARLMLDDFAEGFNVGASYVSGKYDVTDRLNSVRTGFHLRIDSDKLFGNELYPVLLGEYVTGKDEGDSAVSGKDRKVTGFYAQLSSRITPLAEIVARYDSYDNDEEVTDNAKTATSLGVVLHLWDNFQIKG